MGDITNILADYLSLVDAKVRAIEGRMVDRVNGVRALIEEAEKSEAFRALAEGCRTQIALAHERFWSSATDVETWQDALSTFFRVSGFYLKIAEASPPKAEHVLERFMAEIERTHCTVTYFALFDNVELASREIHFGDFFIKYHNESELKKALAYQTRFVFYPETMEGLSRFAHHYFLVVSEKQEVGTAGVLRPLDELWSNVVPTRPTRFPPRVEHGLRLLALYNWQPVWTDVDEDSEVERHSGWAAFSVPSMIRITDDLFKAPSPLPSSSEVAMEPAFDWRGNEVGEKPVQPTYCLDEQASRECEKILSEMHDCLRRISDSSPSAGFIQNAVDFLLKAALTRGLEQILWHIAAIEAVLGERSETESVTEVLARRLSRLLAGTNSAQKSLRKKFKSLYGFRSALVHGRRADNDVFRGHLAEARKLARSSVVWAVRAFYHLLERAKDSQTLTPQRSDLLRLIDLEEDERLRIGAQISWLPSSTFPYMPDWIK